jgi:hypothetical protein
MQKYKTFMNYELFFSHPVISTGATEATGAKRSGK